MLLDGHNTKDKRRKASKVVCLKTRIIFVGVAAALILAEADGVQVRGLFFLVNVKMDRKILVVVKSFLKNQRPPLLLLTTTSTTRQRKRAGGST
jgi:hypothetical protein